MRTSPLKYSVRLSVDRQKLSAGEKQPLAFVPVLISSNLLVM
jgi:hypothetical protein